MILSELKFFILCAEQLKPIYVNAGPAQQNQIATFLKTWLFYNSSSKEIFWTGRTSIAANKGNARVVKEHWYGNLSSARRIFTDVPFDYTINGEIVQTTFFNLSKKQQFLEVYKFMQWNYTTATENQNVRPYQNYGIFYGEEINGDPHEAYELAGIELMPPTPNANMLNRVTDFLNTNNNDAYIFEIDLVGNRLGTFLQFLNHQNETIHPGINNVKIDSIKFLNKGCIYKIQNNTKNLTDLYRRTMYSLWNCFENQNEIDQFLEENNYTTGDNGPYRNQNNFTYPNRAFYIDINYANHPRIWLDTYNDSSYKYSLITKLLDFFNASCIIYDFDLEISEL